MKYRETYFEEQEPQSRMPFKTNLKLVERQNIPWSSEVMARMAKCPRAPRPSPLLEEFMKSQGREHDAKISRDNVG